MYKIARLALPVLLITTPMAAQAQGRFNLFGGYSYTNFNYASALPPSPNPVPLMRSLNGWNASLEGRVFPFIGIVADFSGYSGKETVGLACPLLIVTFCAPDNENVRLYTFLLGPQVSFSIARFTPFAHALVGGAHAFEGLGDCQCLLPNGQPVANSFTETSFAYAVGGGLDYHLIGPIRLRIQADALQTRLRNPLPATPRTTQSNLRLSTGVVFHF